MIFWGEPGATRAREEAQDLIDAPTITLCQQNGPLSCPGCLHPRATYHALLYGIAEQPDQAARSSAPPSGTRPPAAQARRSASVTSHQNVNPAPGSRSSRAPVQREATKPALMRDGRVSRRPEPAAGTISSEPAAIPSRAAAGTYEPARSRKPRARRKLIAATRSPAIAIERASQPAGRWRQRPERDLT